MTQSQLYEYLRHDVDDVKTAVLSLSSAMEHALGSVRAEADMRSMHVFHMLSGLTAALIRSGAVTPESLHANMEGMAAADALDRFVRQIAADPLPEPGPSVAVFGD